MKVYGHDKNWWNTSGDESLQKYYVSCNCGKLLEQKRTLKPIPNKPGKYGLIVETRANETEMSEAVEN